MRSNNPIVYYRKTALVFVLLISAVFTAWSQCSTILSDSITPLACSGIHNGVVTIYASNSTAPYQYQLGIHGTPQSDSTFTGLAAGTDSFYVQDALGCMSFIIANVTSINTSFTPSITASATGTTFCNGSSYTDVFSSASSGSAVLTYQWYKNGAPISGATSSSYTTSSLSDNDSLWIIGYTAAPCATPDSAISNKIHISILAPFVPSVSITAASTSYCSGTTFTDTFWAGGSSAVLTYHWYRNGTVIPGATGSSFSTSTLSNNDSIWVVSFSSLPCATPDSAASNKIIMSIINCPPDTVWPGDADADRIADNNDLLTIGLAYGATGPARTVPGIVWQADTVTRWAGYFTIYAPAVNYDHADCNGDGIIDANDTLAVVTNFGLTHPKTNGSTPWRSGIPNMFLHFSQDTVSDGDTLFTDILLGDASLPVPNIYGLAFTYHYDPLVLDPNSVSLGYVNSWLGDSVNSINIQKIFTGPGEIKTSITGINHFDRGGYGNIAKVRSIITTDNINGIVRKVYTNIAFISDITAVDQYGNLVSLNEAVDSNVIVNTATGISTIGQEIGLSIYPNPAHDRINIVAGSEIREVSISDILGHVVLTTDMSGASSGSINLTNLSDGVYIVTVTTRTGKGEAKLIISR